MRLVFLQALIRQFEFIATEDEESANDHFRHCTLGSTSLSDDG